MYVFNEENLANWIQYKHNMYLRKHNNQQSKAWSFSSLSDSAEYLETTEVWAEMLGVKGFLKEMYTIDPWKMQGLEGPIPWAAENPCVTSDFPKT